MTSFQPFKNIIEFIFAHWIKIMKRRDGGQAPFFIKNICIAQPKCKKFNSTIIEDGCNIMQHQNQNQNNQQLQQAQLQLQQAQLQVQQAQQRAEQQIRQAQQQVEQAQLKAQEAEQRVQQAQNQH